MKALILAGGQGTRLWPLSRKQKPKQFQKLTGSKTMLQETARRLLSGFGWPDIYISTNAGYRAEVKKELPKLPLENIISEPAGRERVASILLFLARLDEKSRREPMVVLPSDHLIKDQAAFMEAVLAARDFVQKNPDYLVAIGAKPDFPDTGLGYIKAGKTRVKSAAMPVREISFFKEKPNLKRTTAYIKSKDYYWNAAIYVFYPELIEQLIAKYVPDNFARYEKIKKLSRRGDRAAIDREYLEMDKASLEYSVIENYDRRAVVCADMGWSDVGSWSVLKNVLSSPGENFVKGNYIDIDSENVMVHGSADKLVAGVGIKNLIIAVCEDIILVCDKDNSQKVKQVIEKLENQKKFNYI